MLLLDSRERAHTRGARRSHCSKVIAGRLRPLRALVLLQKAPWAVRVPSVRVHVQHTSQKMPQRRDWAHGDAARRSPTAALRLHHHRGGGQVCTGTAPRHPPQVMQQPCGEAAPAPTSAPPVARSKEEALQACMEQHRESARAGGVRQGACACLRPPPDTLLPPHTPLQSRSSPVSAPARPGLHLWGAVTRSTARSGTATSSSGCVRGKGGEGGAGCAFVGRAGAACALSCPPTPPHPLCTHPVYTSRPLHALHSRVLPSTLAPAAPAHSDAVPARPPSRAAAGAAAALASRWWWRQHQQRQQRGG